MSAVMVMARWKASPYLFTTECLGAKPDAWQKKVLDAAATSMRVALKASKGPGKSTVLAWLIWWWLSTRPHCKVVCTSITADNLKDGLWTELSKWQQRSDFLKAAFVWRKERIESVESPETWWASARTWPKDGDTNAQADTLAGIHADYVMFVIDEAGGVPDAVAAAAEAGLANVDLSQGRDARFLIAGNPTETEGPLYRACTQERKLWYVYEISGDPDDPERAPRVSIEWARAQIQKYGRDNAYVLVNVFGRFPNRQSNTLMGPDDVMRAQKRVHPARLWMREPKVLGVDVARHGDDRTSLTLRQGPVAFKSKVLREPSLAVVASIVAHVATVHKPDMICIDAGAMGLGVIDRVRQMGHDVIAVWFSEADYEAGMLNRRAGMWFRMAKWIRETGALPDSQEMVAELTAPTYKVNEDGRLQIEKKADIKKRLGFSPDIADSLALTFAVPVMPREVAEMLQAGPTQDENYNPYAKEI